MKQKIMFLMCVMLLVVIPHQVKGADSCSTTLASRYQRIASNVNITTSYQENNGGVSFQVIITNLTPDIVIYDISHDR